MMSPVLGVVCVCEVCVCVCRAAADGAGGVSAEQNHLNVPVGEHGTWATAMTNLGILPVGISGQQLLPGTSRPQV